jgi:hypothetical protein
MDLTLVPYIAAAVWLVMLVVWFLAVHKWSWRKLWCSMLHSQCAWQWQHNEPRRLPRLPTDSGSAPLMTIGRYRCWRCYEWSDGCARYEQRTREMYREQFDRESV